MVIIMKQVWSFHRTNAKKRRACFTKEKKIPGPLGRVCAIPRPLLKIKEMKAKKE